MLSDFEAAVEAALIRQEINSKEVADEVNSTVFLGKFILKNSEGRVLSRIPMDRIQELKDPDFLELEKEKYKPKPTLSKEEIEAKEKAIEEKEKERKEAELQKVKAAEEERINNLKAAEEERINNLKANGIKRWDYKHIRLDFKGRGITQEINLLDIDGERVRSWTDNFSSKEVPTLPELFAKLGDDGWEMISHVVNQDITQNGVTLHYYNFKREKL